jgi:hypothetical protein
MPIGHAFNIGDLIFSPLRWYAAPLVILILRFLSRREFRTAFEQLQQRRSCRRILIPRVRARINSRSSQVLLSAAAVLANY